MAYQLEIAPLAANELAHACCHYDALREGLGDEIAEEFEKTCGLIVQNPDAFSYYRNPFRQAKVARFPYVIVYEVRGTIVTVASFFNTYQDPGKKPFTVKF